MSKVTNIRNEEELKEMEAKKLKRGFKVLAVVAVGAGLYGFKLGRKFGYKSGVKDGYITAGNEVIDAWKKVRELEGRVLDVEALLEERVLDIETLLDVIDDSRE